VAWLTRLLLLFTGLVRWPLRAWVRAWVTPSDLGELDLDPKAPVCYVLPGGGLADWLTLEAVCAAHGLPRPHPAANRLPSPRRALVLALPLRRGKPRSELHRIVARGQRDDDFQVQLVPVSIFWGRDPVKETSLFRILFADSERAGRLRKLLIILAQGRRVLVHFGQPVNYRDFLADGIQTEAVVRKLVRVLRIHFRRQRMATLGPRLSHRSRVINSLLADVDVRKAIEQTAHVEGITVEAARARARDYANEIAADYSNIAIGFMLRVLTWLWNRIYAGVDVRHLQRLRSTAHDRSLIYLPAHRSHMDYLLVSYILYQEGLALPQIAAGVNLDFWPIGGLLRRCGAFYIRRSFRGEQLYTAVFRAYVDVLIGRGQPIKFYLEGGRSRTGRLLPPKTGMLAMVVHSFLRHADKPAAIVPVYIGYDRVMEVHSYFDELRGMRPKKGESVRGLMRGGRKVFERKYGRAYVAFGEPVALDRFADAVYPDWRKQPVPEAEGERPAWFDEIVDRLAETAMVRINATATLNPAGLVALVLLGSPQKAVVEDEMIRSLELLAALARACPYADDITVPELSGREMLAEAEPLTRLVRVPHAWGDVLTVESREAVLLTYARNSVMHLFALPSLLANFFSHAQSRREAGLLDDCVDLYPLLASELFLRWPEAECREPFARGLAGMVEVGLLTRADDGSLRRPAVGSHGFAALMSLARIMRESLERYAMTLVLLANNLPAGRVRREGFERQCQLMAERMAILSGRNSPEFFDLRLFGNHLQTLARIGLLQSVDGELHLDPGLHRLAEHALQLLGPDLRQSILHLTSRRLPAAHRAR
jgi:glycerol-3-phosphate O-acyltransferase